MHRPTESPNSTTSPTAQHATAQHAIDQDAPPQHATTGDIIDVALGERSYQIELSSGKWMDSVGRIRAALPDLSHALVIADQAVEESWSAPVVEGLRRVVRCDSFQVPSGEGSKSLAMLGQLWEWMHGCGADRKSVVLAIGGGVIGDLAGFAAASYARGIRLVQMPTTLLSQVDSSVGGKTGINLAHGKNMVGAFWQPSLVLIDTETLTTLPQRTYLSGLAEVVKYGVIEDAEFFGWLERNASALVARAPGAIRHAVATSCRIKASVVANDERETSGRRAILNYGHTFAHAIEATAGYGRWLHGEAVAMGMEMAASLAQSLGSVDETFVRRQRALIAACSLPTTWADADPQAMIAAMRTDKKVAHSNLRFILPTRVGQVEMVTCNDTAAIARAIESCR